MAYEEIRGQFDPLGPDSPLEVERKLNATGAALAAAYPGVTWVPVRLTYSSFNGGLDSPTVVQAKLNSLFAQVAAAQGAAAPDQVALNTLSAAPSLLGGAPVTRPANAASAVMQAGVIGLVNRLVGRAKPAAPVAPVTPAAPAPLRFAVTNQRAADLSRTLTAANDRMQQRTFHLLGGAVTEVRLGVSPRYMTLGGEAAVSAAFTVDKMALEVEGVGTYPATFSGARSRVINPEEVLVWSDPVVIPAATLAVMTRDTRLWARAQFTATGLRLPINTCYLIGSSASWAGSSAYLYPSADAQSPTVIDQVDATGAYEVPAGNQTSGVNNNMRTGQSSNTGHTVPVYIAAKFATAGVRAVCVIGDSNSAGVGDPDIAPVYASNGTIGGRGLMSRVSVASEAEPLAIPVFNSGLSGALASTWAVNDLRKAAMGYCDVVIDAMGNNDASFNADAATIMARRRLIWADAQALGCKVVALYIPPRTVSSSNNTPSIAAFMPGGSAQVHNSELSQEQTAGRINAVLNIRQYIADSVDDTIWLTPVSTYVRSDGAHFKSGSTTAIATPLRALVRSV